MNILITGGSGFIGQHLVKSFTDDGHQVTILSRKDRTSDNRLVTYREWNGKEMPMALGIHEVVINLAGASLADGRWSDAYKQVIIDSRVHATQACVDYIENSNRPPKVFISASAVGFYGGLREEKVDESSAPGDDFMADTCIKWEEASRTSRCRVVNPRIGVVLGKDGGALPQMITPYKFWLGGKFGSGNQGFPWIHIDDIVGAIRFAIDNESLSGPVNLVGPQLLDQAAFSEKLAHALGVMDLMWVPKFGLKLIFGEKGIILWGGQKVVPTKLQEAGYGFKFAEAEAALKNLV
jgi:uncharacterized protein (TIGR01777 family)